MLNSTNFFKKTTLAISLIALGLGKLHAAPIVKDIQVEGNQRISYETINTYLPIAKDQELTQEKIASSIQALYKTGFFKDVNLFLENGDVLKIKVLERPSIADIKIEGNELIKTDDMNQALEALGVKKGRIFNATQMDRIILDLRRRYQNQGYYAADVNIVATDLPRNRVSLTIKVEEGKPASIGRITLVGNKTYTDQVLKGVISLTESALIGDSDKYAKPKLEADLETIKSYYMDRGFAEFEIVSSQVSLALDKTKVFITINVKEGPQYSVEKIRFSGKTILLNEELRGLLKIEEEQLFNRSAVIASVNAIRDRLSEEGYAFAEVEPLTVLDKENRLVNIDFRIEPKDRVYVRKIVIEGNTRTRDHVIRREMRQFESAPYSLKDVQRSNTRLNRLGYFKVANIDTQRISKDEVDLVIKVEEQSTGSFNAGVGFSQLDGVSLSLGITERNVIGSGNTASLNGRYSVSTKMLDLNITNPYFTQDAVSLGGGFYFREIDAAELGISDYSTDNLGVRMNLGYPISEYSSLSYGVKLDDQNVVCSKNFIACKSYVEEKGARYSSARLSMGWSYDTKNAFYFPTAGQAASVSVEVAAPIDGSDISFYKLYLSESYYLPLVSGVSLKLKGDLSYADALMNDSGVPFYENFYAGGIGSVRGYEPNSLGPVYNLTTDGSDSPKGGRVKFVSGAELVFPMPFIEDSSNIRMSFFLDAGNVFNDFEQFEASDLRASAGFGVAWITPVGPLAFSLAKPLNDKPEDKTQVFQFNLGIPM